MRFWYILDIHIGFPCHVTLWRLFCLDQSFGSKRETEIQSVEKLPDIRRDEDEVAGSSKKTESQNKSYDVRVNTKVDASKDSNGKEFRPAYIILC
jgi:hypothetical protein